MNKLLQKLLTLSIAASMIQAAYSQGFRKLFLDRKSVV